MGPKTQNLQVQLKLTADWAEFLRANSNLPGPRANLELAEAVFQEGDRTSLSCFWHRIRRMSARIPPKFL